MPWEELLARFRHPVRRQPTPQAQQEPSAPQLPIDRRILQDPSSLLETETHALPLGLTPSTRLPSADGSKARSRSRSRPGRAEPLPELSELPSGSYVDITPRTQFISKIIPGGEWSTFGRKRERVDISVHTPPPDVPQSTSCSPSPTKDSKHLSADSILSTFTPSCITNRHSATHERQSPDIPFSSKRSSPTDTMSSKQHPRTPQGPSSYSTPVAAHAASSTMNATTPVNRELATDSPHTFGHPTPPDNPVKYSATDPCPPPPLPPFDHPELAAVLSSRRQSAPTGQLVLSAFRDRSNTLPTSQRSPRKDDDLFASLSLKLGRHRPNTRAERVSNTAMADERQRARTMSGDAGRRRTSADWSSYQASVGVNSHANQAWPAAVSRAILRLSLGGPSGPDSAPGSPERRNQGTRGHSADPVRRSDRGALPPSFLPFPRPSRPNSPSPPTASAALPDGREVIPSRSHSLRFDLGNRTQQPARFRMAAEVKRSLSDVEARSSRNNKAGGATYPPSGISDPEAPQSLRHPFLAPTPSQSLPSGRVSPTNTPMVSSSQGEPSTPTPAPRHLSDKSRGKRKAEDNIDLTPPEQKKEGQRATFLLPSEPRSQRVSNSSHAPSSYHRKRARLSSTSPFTTPVQSRPSSVHETPKSASRNHHFTSLSSGTGARVAPSRTPSRAASTHSRQPPTPSTTRKHERRQSVSQVSIPISAIVSPHAPSVSRSNKFHMRDPRKPPKKPNDTPWSLRFATEDEPGSPIQAWCFFFGFLFFPIWWIAGLLLGVPKTRIAGDGDAEKGVTIDDPQIEYDAKAWRFRCRVMAVLSLFTYIPFIVLVAIFAPR